jgi:hypothetical protein
MNASDFFLSNSSITNFINNLCALLNIVDTSRVKVVGVHSGSMTITVGIGSPNTPTDSSTATVATTLNTLVNSGSFSSTMSSIGFGNVLGVTSAYYQLDAV